MCFGEGYAGGRIFGWWRWMVWMEIGTWRCDRLTNYLCGSRCQSTNRDHGIAIDWLINSQIWVKTPRIAQIIPTLNHRSWRRWVENSNHLVLAIAIDCLSLRKWIPKIHWMSFSLLPAFSTNVRRITKFFENWEVVPLVMYTRLLTNVPRPLQTNLKKLPSK